MQLEGQIRIPSGCAISAIISKEGNRMTGEKIIQSMIPMHDRSNGLGGGCAAYGIYPEYRDFDAFHIFFQDDSCRVECEKFLKDSFEIVKAETIPNPNPGQDQSVLNPETISAIEEHFNSSTSTNLEALFAPLKDTM